MKTNDFSKSTKIAAYYTIPWLVLTLVMGGVSSYLMANFLGSFFVAVPGLVGVIGMAIGVLLAWIVWLWARLPEYLARYHK